MITRFVLTAKGSALFAKWQTGTVPQFTKIQIGKGHFSGPDASTATALVTPVKDLAIVGCTSQNNSAYVKADFSNAGITAGFDWTEIGLFATDPTDGEILYGYGYDNTDPTHIPAESESPVSFLFTMTTAIGNAAQATAIIDPATVYATTAQLANYGKNLTSENDIQQADTITFHDTSAGVDRKTTLLNLFEKIMPWLQFSTTPVRIGKWLDTQYNVYMVVVPFASTADNATASFTAPADIQEFVIVIGGGQSASWLPVPFASTSEIRWQATFRCSKAGNVGTVEFLKGTSVSFNTGTLRAIVIFVC